MSAGKGGRAEKRERERSTPGTREPVSTPPPAPTRQPCGRRQPASRRSRRFPGRDEIAICASRQRGRHTCRFRPFHGGICARRRAIPGLARARARIRRRKSAAPNSLGGPAEMRVAGRRASRLRRLRKRAGPSRNGAALPHCWREPLRPAAAATLRPPRVRPRCSPPLVRPPRRRVLAPGRPAGRPPPCSGAGRG